RAPRRLPAPSARSGGQARARARPRSPQSAPGAAGRPHAGRRGRAPGRRGGREPWPYHKHGPNPAGTQLAHRTLARHPCIPVTPAPEASVPQSPSIAAMTVVAALIAVPVVAQQAPDTNAAPTTSAAPTPSSPPGGVATTNNPNLAVAAVKLENGVRASKIIGATVRGEGDQ